MAKLNLLHYETLVHATAGATGGIVAMACIYPLDNIKFRVQVDDLKLSEKNSLEALLYILREEGIEGLYRGIKPTLISVAASNFVYFYSFHGLRLLKTKISQNSGQTDLGLSLVAGVINVITTLPLWVVNSRLKLPEQEFHGLLDGLKHIAITEGVPGLWASLVPSLMLVVNPAIHFTVYEILKRKVSSKSALTFFVLGAISKTLATIVTYPLQLAQSRQRNAQYQQLNTVQILIGLLQRNGFRGLFSGLETKLLQTVLAAALAFMTYEKVARFVFWLFINHRISKKKVA